MLRDMPEAATAFASAPLSSPETESAVWAMSTRVQGRILYGNPGNPALLLLDCDTSNQPTIQITRTAAADEGAGALLALVGNGHIGRVKVDASEVGDQRFWVGDAPASDEVWEPLTGPRELIATVPGAGMVTLNPSALPGSMIASCRAGQALDTETLITAAQPEGETSPVP
ncbi:MAG: hypothetical protein ABJ205_12600 [Erythrobacter sp.]|uniref:hypothetical protein n=1 Tax=Erythrobacter sp. TaxID=1042 RepID=UPI003267AE77